MGPVHCTCSASPQSRHCTKANFPLSPMCLCLRPVIMMFKFSTTTPMNHLPRNWESRVCRVLGLFLVSFQVLGEGMMARVPLKRSPPPSTEVLNSLPDRRPQTGAKLVTCWTNGQKGQSPSLTTAAELTPQTSGQEAQGSGPNSPIS